jgi:NAD(P)-dependent dehydrogenase (short-subunit alcohol dehydrogenase family)
MSMTKRFDDQVAIITGGGSGLGKAIANRLAREGAMVYIFDRDESVMTATTTEFEKEGLLFNSYHVDITDELSVQKKITAVYGQHQRLDVMVNCAGIIGPHGNNITEIDTAGFDTTINVNLRGSFLMTKYSLREMMKQNYGRVLLVASIAGKEGNAGMCAYSTSKSGVIGLVKAVGKEFAESGMTINGLAPAVIRTDMVDKMEEAQVTYMTDKIPMKRCGTLDEVASLACWIVSKEASFNTGFTFDLSGGRATY